MEEIKIWAIDGSGAVVDLSPTGQTETEKLLEDALVSSPDLLLEDLILVGRQTQTEGGPLDLLGVDGDGRLVVFELKRGTLSREAVAQVIDYASDLDAMELEDLAEYISEKSSQHDDIDTIEDFEDWYSRYSENLDSLKPLRMFLIGLGVDPDAERMVKFLSENSGMDMSLLTFHGFNYDGMTILAKRMEAEGAEAQSTRPPNRSSCKEEQPEPLKNHVSPSKERTARNTLLTEDRAKTIIDELEYLVWAANDLTAMERIVLVLMLKFVDWDDESVSINYETAQSLRPFITRKSWSMTRNRLTGKGLLVSLDQGNQYRPQRY